MFTDAFLGRHSQALSFSTAPARPVSTLRNWIEGTGCVARAETAYLEHGEDLVSLATPEDNIVTWLETLAEYASLYFQKQSEPENPQGPDVYRFTAVANKTSSADHPCPSIHTPSSNSCCYLQLCKWLDSQTGYCHPHNNWIYCCFTTMVTSQIT